MNPPPHFTPTAEQISAAETVFLAMAHVGVIKPVVEAYQREILAKHQWKADPLTAGLDDAQAQRPILDPKHAYLLGPEDSAVYYKACNEARIASGLHVEDPAFCPALVAEDDLRKARRALVDSLAPVTGVTADQLLQGRMSNYERFVELSLKLLAPYCKPQEVLQRIRDEALVERSRERPAG